MYLILSGKVAHSTNLCLSSLSVKLGNEVSRTPRMLSTWVTVSGLSFSRSYSAILATIMWPWKFQALADEARRVVVVAIMDFIL
jgi:uncharacterized integral membrane protein